MICIFGIKVGSYNADFRIFYHAVDVEEEGQPESKIEAEVVVNQGLGRGLFPSGINMH